MRTRLVVCLTLVLLAGASALLSACNTTAGAGRDISATGQAITKGADKLKP
jgi:predicted small secreted protein